jgi:hypothetical protein
MLVRLIGALRFLENWILRSLILTERDFFLFHCEKKHF